MCRYQKKWREKRQENDYNQGQRWRFAANQGCNQSVKQEFSLVLPYPILGIEPTATDKEVKKKYRKLAKQHHPYKVFHLGESHQASATDKLQKIAEAYSIIEESRKS
jgi:DnaJ-class molecular chaperone